MTHLMPRNLTKTAARFGGARRALLFAALTFAVASLAYADEINVDKVLRFSTPGIDRYADGSIVLDGECYALVWSPAGKAFSGFNADGTAASSEDHVILAGALAQGGRCRDSIFQVSADVYAALEGGEWAVCLVDTRKSNGTPAGVRNGLPVRVNRWGIVTGGVSVTPVSISALPPGQGAGMARPYAYASGSANPTGIRATRLSSVPAYTRNPTITGMDLSDGVVILSVADTVPYLTYTIESGPRLSIFAIDGAADVVDGENGVEIEIATGAYGATRFFRVIRAE